MTGEYALRASVFLARQYPTPRTAVQIAGAVQVSCGYLSKVLQTMVKSELVASQRGIHGGYVLIRPPSQISLLDVLESVGSAPQGIDRCPLGLRKDAQLCRMHGLVNRATETAREAFATASLADYLACIEGVSPFCNLP